ncbi:G-protein coupled receptors family 1 profile domain-containing protein [Caenorhabditis elegans]|uniref:G-protein coupled receptors family 1 profile domain-containing protein n=1 Tax=Caenorhabditis elegans TaxID=6239 RepID=Q9XUN0_CAEEL|nr:G-protein coupled receptors family 1 profile domain-containing protein [Caenorhabditis elegans]CAB04860.2 G-protein coupled receptors family 1 profile domain-containing protein [Caenorhabditis elegans]|eukprot:NP_506793.2 Serpentine Receptor, class X [Caenorhabditis elegans]
MLILNDEQISAVLIFPLAFIGFMANWSVAFLIKKLPSLKNSFGMLTTSQSIGDAVHSTIFAFIVSSMCFFDLKFLKSYSYIVGHILIITYEVSTYSHLCISLNRFCSIVAPISYESIFNSSNTKQLIIISWALAIFPSFYFYVYNDCKLFYNEVFSAFFFTRSPSCSTIVWYADYLKFNSIVIAIVIIDVITVSKVRSFKTKISAYSNQSAKKSSTEMNFLKQACLQAFVFVCELVCYFLIAPKVIEYGRWFVFLLTTIPWVSVHMLDGIITLTFNKDFSQFILYRLKISELTLSSFLTIFTI